MKTGECSYGVSQNTKQMSFTNAEHTAEMCYVCKMLINLMLKMKWLH